MAFERFTLTGRGFKPKVSVRSNGQIGLNNGAIRRFGLDRYSYGILFFDRSTGRIGIKVSNDEMEDGAVKLNVKDKTAWISAKAFLDYYDLPYEQTRKYDVDWQESEQMMVFQVGKDKGEIVTSNDHE